ncbi:MAG: alkaline phosphatase family protein [Lentisphaeria bacterium]
MTAVRKTLVVQVAALGKDFLEACNGSLSVCGLSAYGLKPVFPAVTCTAQASLRTGMAAGDHGIVANGWMRPQESKVEFWNQSAHLLPPAEFGMTLKNRVKGWEPCLCSRASATLR